MQSKQYYVYIATNKINTVLYIGITNELVRRIYEHKQKLVEGFTARYKLDKLVYYEIFTDAQNAIFREKQLKGGSRQKKLSLIIGMNPDFSDIYEAII